VPIRCGGVVVEPGDLVVADEDGVVVIPAESVAEVVAGAMAKAAIEDHVRSSLAAGESIVDTYGRFGVM
jgi:4-hydroxy-4-methyl-2-oxoglutarate aldolase